MSVRARFAVLAVAAVVLTGCSGATQSNLTPNTALSGAAFANTTYTYADLGPGPNGKDAYG